MPVVYLDAIRNGSSRSWLLALTTVIALAVPRSAVSQDAATKAPSDVLDPRKVEYFERYVRPLFVEHCFECHSNKKQNGGLNLSSRELLARGGDSGPVVVPGKVEQSLLLEAVRYTNPHLQMPPKKMLSKAEIDRLEKWVADGAVDPRLDSMGEKTGAEGTKPGMSIEEGRRFWSLLPISSPVLPGVSQLDWVRTPIDTFVLSKLEENGMVPAEDADKRTWLRRVSLDMTGLPPTQEEILQFLNDESPAAFENVVDRLLASPQYGVRWGRHWLDVARYADSNGLDENLAFGNAWRYRDYVVDSFNEDLPWDRFVKEQIAGDLVSDASVESRTATGFLVLGAKVLAEPDRVKLEMDTIDEQIDTISKAFLGMTWGCMRCHDHKFDPFQQSDYYSLAAIFKSTKTFGDGNLGAIKYWNESSFATPDEKEQLKKIDAEIASKKAAASKYKAEAMARARVEARKKAAEYLGAAARIVEDMSHSQMSELATQSGLNPRILHHCRLHLELHAEEALFKTWWELRDSEGPEAIESYYRRLFSEVEEKWEEAKKSDASVKKLSDERLEEARQALYDSAGFLAVPPQAEFAISNEELEEYYRLSEIARLAESAAPDEASSMSVAEGRPISSLAIHIRGSHHNLGSEVTRGIPVVFRPHATPMIFPRHQSGRLQFADWLVAGDNPLTARVLVNRIWRWHMGVGLVASTDNFGVLGDRPTHPELLDFLARYLVESGWSLKELQRMILLSSTYRMASNHRSEASNSERDPENKWLWKFRIQRLDAEQLRDSILAVGGQLDLSLGGKSIPLRNRQFVFDHTSIDHTRYDSIRRAIYLPVVRNNLYSWFEQFDFPDPTMPTGNRNETTVAPQALMLLNLPLVMDSADRMASNVTSEGSSSSAIVQAFERAIGRHPSVPELERIEEFFARTGKDGVPPESEGAKRLDNAEGLATREDYRKVWSAFCQILMASNEFCYVR